MKSKYSKKKLSQLSAKEVSKALKWIESLTPKQLAKFDQLGRVQLAQILFEAYMNRKQGKRFRK